MFYYLTWSQQRTKYTKCKTILAFVLNVIFRQHRNNELLSRAITPHFVLCVSLVASKIRPKICVPIAVQRQRPYGHAKTTNECQASK